VGMAGSPRVLGVGAGFHGRPGTAGWSGRVAVGSSRVQGLKAVPGGGQGSGPFPAGWDLQDSSSGVGDQAGGSGEDSEAQRLGGCFGQVAVQSEVAQPSGQRGGQGGQLQPGGVTAVVDRGQIASAAGLEPSGLRRGPGCGAGRRGTGPARRGCW
jgi:hypothetical protein